MSETIDKITVKVLEKKIDRLITDIRKNRSVLTEMLDTIIEIKSKKERKGSFKALLNKMFDL